jgi:hypothetical protein
MSKSKTSRKPIDQKIWRLMAIAIRFGLKVESMECLAGFTAKELEPYTGTSIGSLKSASLRRIRK